MQEWEIMIKFILPALAAAILLIPQPAEAWSQRRRQFNLQAFTINVVLPYAFTILLVGGMHFTWPVDYKGEGRKK